VEKAVHTLRRPGNGLIRIAVNVSAASLTGDAYTAAVLRMTALTPDERRRLMIEVTETAAMSDLEAADRRLRALRQAGVRVCIDDFGAGSASFDYLRGLSVDMVKIDGGFVKDLGVNPRSRTLITHLVELCGSLKLKTVAEMIETEETADALRAIGVDYGQGWLFGKATPEPVVAAPSSTPVRRVGEVQGWG
jgi:EAL domain-containing protein (putative c-di-GMP-specific phosphodiesterase class I)